MAREWLLMKRNSFFHAFKSAQLVVVALITMTMFIRTRTNIDGHDARSFMASMFYSLIRLTANALPEIPFTVSRLAVCYKQRNFHFCPAWAYSIPAAILNIPFFCLDSLLWTPLTYYVIGYSPEPERLFCQFLVLFLVNQLSVNSFRLIASIFPNHSSATFCGLFYLVAMFLFCGFVVPQPSLPRWMEWGFWVSPLTYAGIGVVINEFLAPRWEKIRLEHEKYICLHFNYIHATIGHQVLTNCGLNYTSNFFWISIGALVGITVFLNFGFTCALSFSKAPGGSRAVISHEQNDELPNVRSPRASVGVKRTGVVLPFEPKAITFENLQYFVDTPKKMRNQGLEQNRLKLLQDITGSFRPGILTALMGVSGAGKTTLLDELSGRKNSGNIEGEIRVGGYPKDQDTYARISGYSEQVTIQESLKYSAWLRLLPLIQPSAKSELVEDVLQMIEFNEIKDALVGRPGVNGISNEQRKRLTIAVELVSNPSIIFMDEPTSGLDARAAAIVMRVVKNVVNIGRTVVCTIHQPSIDIFETFDELILMKRGGQIIYSGELGQHSSKLIEYFENIPGVPKIQGSYNPATWMLNVSSSSMEELLKIDFGQLYRESDLCREMKERVRELRSPPDGSEELHFSTRFPRNGWEQFNACIWKQNLSYWRTPNYNLGRVIFIIMTSLLLGAILWRKGQNLRISI